MSYVAQNINKVQFEQIKLIAAEVRDQLASRAHPNAKWIKKPLNLQHQVVTFLESIVLCKDKEMR